MSIERTVLAFAGFVVVVSVLLSVYHNQNWLYLTGFVGVNLFQSAFTGFCPLANILKMLGLKSDKAAA